jgi:hypothetical protein
MSITKNRIHSKGDYRLEEYPAGEADIYPGMLLEMASDGEVIKHDSEYGFGEFMIAAEDALQGHTVDDAYTIHEIVQCLLPTKGAEVNLLIEDGEDVEIGEILVSSANGHWRVATAGESAGEHYGIMAMAVENCDTTVSGVLDTLCAARVI